MERRVGFAIFIVTASCLLGRAATGTNALTGQASSAITSVAVTCSPASITPQQTSTCAATVKGTGSYSSKVTWAVSPTSAGAVSASGVFTPTSILKAVTKATLIATSTQDTTKSGSAIVTVTPPTIASVTVACSPATITVSQTSACAATVKGTGTYSSGVTWAISPTSAGSVSSRGAFTPASTLTVTTKATITATSTQDKTKTGSAAVTIAGPTITSVSASCAPATVTTAQTSACTASVTGTGNFNSAVNWSVSPASAGVVNSAGVYTPAPTLTGTTSVTITARSAEDSTKSATAAIFVVGPSILSVSALCSPTSITVAQTSTCGATVTGKGNYNSGINWTVSPPSVGTISPLGAFTPTPSLNVAAKAKITATSVEDNTKTASATVDVLAPTINSVSVTCVPASISFTQTSNCTAFAQGTGNFNPGFTWSVNPPSAGKVTSAGVFTPASGLSSMTKATVYAISKQDPTKWNFALVSINPPGFSINLSATGLTLPLSGTSQVVEATVTPQYNFTGTVTFTFKNLPAGVTASPASFTVNAGATGAFTLSTSGVKAAPATCTLEATAGSIKVDTTLDLSFEGPPIRAQFFVVGGELESAFYDENRQMLFATNPGLAEVDVFSGADLSLLARVPMMLPGDIDQMADGKTLVIGSGAQGIYTMDEDTRVVTWHLAPKLTAPPRQYTYGSPTALANGTVLVLANGDLFFQIGGGNFRLFAWDPVMDTFTMVEDPSNPGTPLSINKRMARSADRRWAVGGNAADLYLYSSDTGSIAMISGQSIAPGLEIDGAALNADGSQISMFGWASYQAELNLYFLDPSLKVLGSSAAPTGTDQIDFNLTYSPDGKRVYITTTYPVGTTIEAYDTTSMKALGFYYGDTMPMDLFGHLLTVDKSGRAYFGVSGGLRVADTTKVPVPGTFPYGAWCNEPDPNATPLDTTQVGHWVGIAAPSGWSMYFGGNQGYLIANNTEIEIPASAVAGPVDIECIDLSGNTQVRPFDFSYGVEPVGVTATLLPPTGNPVIDVFGFGMLNSDEWSAPSVTIGGVSSSVLGIVPDPGGSNLAGLVIQAPNGAAGNPADITISSSNGTGTLAGGVTYIPLATILPATRIEQVLFDTHRNLLYALKTGEVDVLDPTSLSWKPPLQLPASVSAAFLVAMALSPDGTKMVLVGGGGVFVLNPDQPSQASQVQTNGLTSQIYSFITITNANIAVFPGASIDLNTLVATKTNLWVAPEGAWPFIPTLLRASPDGSRLYGVVTDSSSAGVADYDPSTLAWTAQTILFGVFLQDLAASPDGSLLAVSDGYDIFFFDPNIDLMGYAVYPNLSADAAGQNWGLQFSPQGKVLVVPTGDSIEFFDASLGTLKARLMTPEPLGGWLTPGGSLGWVLPQMALDSIGRTIFAVSASGLTVLQMPTPIDQMPSTNWPPYEQVSPVYVVDDASPKLHRAGSEVKPIKK